MDVIPAPRAVLYDRPFLAILLVVFLGFVGHWVVQPVLPLLVLHVGGDATLVGFLTLTFAVPSVVFRPFLGRLADTWSRRKVLLIGTLGLGFASTLYALPSLPAIFTSRAIHGTAWAAFNTASRTSLADMVPTSRRGEASSTYSLMASLAQLIGPAAGLLVLGATGFVGSFALASASGLAAAFVLRWALAPESRPLAPARHASLAGLVEHSAVRPMLIESLWVAVNSLFVIFPPVLAAQWSSSVADLAGYYATVGIVLIGAQFVGRRRLDEVPRHRLLLFAIGVGFVAILIASQAASVVALTAAGCVWAIGSSLVSPIAMASAIDRAPTDADRPWLHTRSATNSATAQVP
jgi:MFS family permease